MIFLLGFLETSKAPFIFLRATRQKPLDFITLTSRMVSVSERIVLERNFQSRGLLSSSGPSLFKDPIKKFGLQSSIFIKSKFFVALFLQITYSFSFVGFYEHENHTKRSGKI